MSVDEFRFGERLDGNRHVLFLATRVRKPEIDKLDFVVFDHLHYIGYRHCFLLTERVYWKPKDPGRWIQHEICQSKTQQRHCATSHFCYGSNVFRTILVRSQNFCSILVQLDKFATRVEFRFEIRILDVGMANLEEIVKTARARARVRDEDVHAAEAGQRLLDGGLDLALGVGGLPQEKV